MKDPLAVSEGEYRYKITKIPGRISRRDYFAGCALMGIIVSEGTSASSHRRDAVESFEIADAMIQASAVKDD